MWGVGRGWARALLGATAFSVMVGCNDPESPTAISDEVLSLQAFQTATGLDPLGDSCPGPHADHGGPG